MSHHPERKLTIAFDCDDVLVDTSSVLLAEYNRVYGTSVSLRDFYADDYWQAPTPEVAMERVDTLLREGLLADIAPREETIEYISRLYRDGHELHVVTGRQSYQLEETMGMLAKYFPGMFSTVEYTNMYASGSNLHLRRTKGKVCRELNAHMLVDDHLFHGEDVLCAGVENVVIYGDTPWNQIQQMPASMVRCIGMRAVYHEVQRVAAK